MAEVLKMVNKKQCWICKRTSEEIKEATKNSKNIYLEDFWTDIHNLEPPKEMKEEFKHIKYCVCGVCVTFLHGIIDSRHECLHDTED